ncbi:MAG: oligosaccharide flippase family protein [Candidatus Pacebacteria bacterium]|nr:oligosaccharide flippase family protein [Candidatus Paceibacterota bacterium]
MNILSRIIKDSFLLILAETIGKAAVFFIFIIIARKFGSEIFGQFSYAMSFSLIFFNLASFGMGAMLIREIAINKKNASLYFSNSLFIKIILSILTLCFIFVTTQLIKKAPEVNFLIYILSFYVMARSFNEFFYVLFKAYEKIKYVTFLRLFESFILILFLLFLINFNQSVYIISLSFATSSFFALMVASFLIKSRLINFSIKKDSKIIKSLIKKNIFFGLFFTFIIINFNIGILLTSIFKGDQAAGIYAVSYNLFFVSTIIIQPLHSVLYPVMSRKISEFKGNNIKIKQLIKKVVANSFVILGVGIIAILSYYYFGDIFIKFLYGQGFKESFYSLKILAFVIPLWYAFMIIKTIFFSIGKQSTIFYVLFVGVVVNIASSLLLVPVYSGVGAAISMLLAVIFLVVVGSIKLIIYYKT